MNRNLMISIMIAGVIQGCGGGGGYYIKYNSEPTGASLMCDGKNEGYTPVTLRYEPSDEDRKNGRFYTRLCYAKWVSGAEEYYDNEWDLNKFPDGVWQTLHRPNGPGYSQDAEFALKVEQLKQNERIARREAWDRSMSSLRQSLNQMSQNLNTNPYHLGGLGPSLNSVGVVNCKKNDIRYPEIKTFSNTCPWGWYPVY